jgi:uncharacterized Zn-finger protein
MEGLSDSNYPWPASNFSDQEDIYPPHLYNEPQTITTANSTINFSVSEFVETLPSWDLSNFNWPISLQDVYGTRYTDIGTCLEEHSLHNLFTNVEPPSELNIMPNNVAGEDPNHSILGMTVPSLVTKKKYICPVDTCKHKTFSRKADLERHSLTHTGERPFECRFEGCNRVGKRAFTRRDKLVDHQRKVHKATRDERRACHLITSMASSQNS